MKKIQLLFIGLAFLASTVASAQPIFSEDFNGAAPLSTWTLINNDGLTPNANVSAITNAWVVLNGAGGDNFAVSTSWYSPAGTADDYMITPAITLTNNNYVKYEELAPDGTFADDYEVLISTTTPTIAGLTANPVLYSNTSPAQIFTPRFLDLSAYSGQAVHIAWRNKATDEFLLYIDNVEVREAFTNDIEMLSLSIPNNVTVNSMVPISGSLRNLGKDTLTSFTLEWTADGGTTVSTEVINVSVPPFGTINYSHQTQWTATTGSNLIEVYTSLPNGGTDGDNANDTISVGIAVGTTGMSVSKQPLLEEFTTAPCQFCPDGAVVVENILNSNPAVIGVGLHACFGSDAMTISEATVYCSAFGSGAPTACVDRVLYPGETDVAFSRANNQWLNRSNSQSMLGAPVDVNVTGSYNPNNATGSIDVTADFVDYIAGDVRVTLFVVEDHVRGTGNGFDQVNFYNTQAGHPFAGAGNPILNYDHRHVLRDVYPSNDAWGDNTTIPVTPALNTTYTMNSTITVDPSWDADSISLVGFVSYFNDNVGEREVLNAFEVKLQNLVTSVEQITLETGNLSIYPNPTNSITNLEFVLGSASNVQLELFDLTGKKLRSENFGTLAQGKQVLQLNVEGLNQGFYFINMNIDGKTITKKISVIK